MCLSQHVLVIGCHQGYAANDLSISKHVAVRSRKVTVTTGHLKGIFVDPRPGGMLRNACFSSMAALADEVR